MIDEFKEVEMGKVERGRVVKIPETSLTQGIKKNKKKELEMKTFYELIANGQEFELDTVEEKAICLEYSEEKETLESFINDLKIKVKPKGIEKHFVDDEEPRQILEVTLTRGNKGYKFDFGLSLVDTAKIRLIKNGVLKFGFDVSKNVPDIRTLFNVKSSSDIYNLYTSRFYSDCLKPINLKKFVYANNFLYSVLSGFGCPIPYLFEEFCDEFGYEKDSIKAKKTFKKCLKQEIAISRIFTETERQSFPR